MSEPGETRAVVFDPAARDELAEAVAYYDAQRAGVGDEMPGRSCFDVKTPATKTAAAR